MVSLALNSPSPKITYQTLVSYRGTRASHTNDTNPIFQADRPRFYLLGYAVGDGELTSGTVFQRLILIGPTPPNANASDDKLSYSWSVLSQPAASQFTLKDSDKRVMKLSADTTGSYTLQVEVTDGFITDTDSVLLTLENNKAPTAVIAISNPIDPYVTKYQIQLDASHSTDQLSYSWKLLAEPAASNTRIIDYNHARKEQATLSTYVEENYTVELTANDGVSLIGANSMQAILMTLKGTCVSR